MADPTGTVHPAVWRVAAGMLFAAVAGLVAAIVHPIARGVLVEPVNALGNAIRDLDAILTDTERWWGNPMSSAALQHNGVALSELKKEADRLHTSVNRLGAINNAVAWRRLWVCMRVVPARADVEEAQRLLRGVANHFRSDWELGDDAPPPDRQNQADVAEARRLLWLPARP